MNIDYLTYDDVSSMNDFFNSFIILIGENIALIKFYLFRTKSSF